MRQPTARLSFLLLCLLLLPLTQRAEGITLTFAPGDVFVSLESGEVQWRHPDGTLNQVLTGKIPAKAMGMGFDGAGNLYVTRWCAYYAVTGDPTCAYNGTGNTVEKFDTTGTSQGSFGSGYDCRYG